MTNQMHAGMYNIACKHNATHIKKLNDHYPVIWSWLTKHINKHGSCTLGMICAGMYKFDMAY